MIEASLSGHGLQKNRIFDLNSTTNRDNCFEPYVRLKEHFARHSITLNTQDMNEQKGIVFELQQDIQPLSGASKNYVMLFETPFIKPKNGDSQLWSKYNKVFTWNDELVDGERFIKLNFPNPLSAPIADGWQHRARFCCLIAGNKSVVVPDERELYSERVRAIRWFEKNAPQAFDLYGIDWDLPPPRAGLWGKITKRLWRYVSLFFGLKPFASYRGKVEHKRDVLLNTRYAICYENVRDLSGYITEKIFDCFFAGCVPVYWGANNITDYIPADCFIDRRQFKDTAEVYQYLMSLSEGDFIAYQQRIAHFLQSEQARPFGSDFFAETIVNTIVDDLKKDA